MKAISITVRNVTAGQRDEAGAMVLRSLGDVTVTLKAMTRAEVAEWEWATLDLNTRGLDEEIFLLAVNGWKVMHGDDVLGLLFQGAGTRVRVESYDPTTGDFFFTGNVARLRHGAAQIVNARQRAGHAVPVDVEPEPIKAPAPAAPVWLADSTQVRYHGSLTQLHGIYRVFECDCANLCDGYELLSVDGSWVRVAEHVRRTSVTPLEAAAA